MLCVRRCALGPAVIHLLTTLCAASELCSPCAERMASLEADNRQLNSRLDAVVGELSGLAKLVAAQQEQSNMLAADAVGAADGALLSTAGAGDAARGAAKQQICCASAGGFMHQRGWVPRAAADDVGRLVILEAFAYRRDR